MTINSTLTTYGFSLLSDGSLFWGVGSVMWGDSVTVKRVGADRYSVTIAHWAYDCDDERMCDTSETRTLYGAQALAWVFTEMPNTYFWR